MTDYNKAREMWAALNADARKKILAALNAGEHLHDHEFAALPPEVHAGIVAGMPVEAAAEPDEEPTEEPTPRGRRKKDDD